MKKLEIYRKNTIVLMAVCCLLVIILLQVLFIFVFKDTPLVSFFKILLPICFVLLFLSFFLLRKKVLLTIDDQGIVYKQVKPDLSISWDEISYFSATNSTILSLVGINLKNPQSYIDRESNKYMKKLLENNLAKYGTPYLLDMNILKTNKKELVDLLNNNLEQFNQNSL